MPQRAELSQYLRTSKLFQTLNDQQMAKLIEVAAFKQLAKNETLFLQGDTGEALYLILNGSVQVYTLSPEGKEKILAILGPGEFFGELSLLDHEPRSANAQAIERAELAVIDRLHFEGLLKDTGIALALLKTLSKRLRETDRHLEELVFKDIQARLAQVLLDLAAQYGQDLPGGRRITLKLTHRQLASYVGSTRESITRSLLNLQDEGYVSFDQRYLVLRDIGALSKIAHIKD